MAIEVLFPPGSIPVGDITGILVAETQMYGVINNKPLRRCAVPYESIDLYKGNKRRLRVYIRDGDLNIVNLTGATAYLTVRHTKDSAVLISKSTAISGQGTIGSPDQGEIFFYLVAADTSALDVAQYVWDVAVYLTGGDGPYTTVEGVINLHQAVR